MSIQNADFCLGLVVFHGCGHDFSCHFKPLILQGRHLTYFVAYIREDDIIYLTPSNFQTRKRPDSVPVIVTSDKLKKSKQDTWELNASFLFIIKYILS